MSLEDPSHLGFKDESPDPCLIQFVDRGEIARLWWSDGELRFEGNADRAAKIFFEQFLKPLVDEYIEARLLHK